MHKCIRDLLCVFGTMQIKVKLRLWEILGQYIEFVIQRPFFCNNPNTENIIVNNPSSHAYSYELILKIFGTKY
jgi:hypothetical protein